MRQEIPGKLDERRLGKNDPGKHKQLNKEIRKMSKNAKEEYLGNIVRKLKNWKRNICRL